VASDDLECRARRFLRRRHLVRLRVQPHPLHAEVLSCLTGRRAAAAGAIALINSIGNIGGFLGPTAIGFVKERTGSYAMSLMSISLCLVLGAGIVLWERAREQRAFSLFSKVSP
jgi:nitrate/nitrite transporter NarK